MAKSLPWFRFYTEVADDPKIHRLSDVLHRFWVNCLCLAGRNRGVLPEVDDIAFHARKPRKWAEQQILALVKLGLLEETERGLMPHNWEKRQYLSDTTVSTERVRDYRQRVRENGMTVGGYLRHKDAVLKRDGYQCVYCGSSEKLCIDHVVPILLGGDDDPTNLATACKGCNSGKAGRMPAEAGMTVRKDCTYANLLLANAARLQVFIDRRAHSREETSVNKSDSETWNRDRVVTERDREHSPSVSVSDSVSGSVVVKENLREETKPPNPPCGGPSVPLERRSQKRADKRTIAQIETTLGVTRLAWWVEWWSIYPCHEDKRSAMDAFERTVKTPETWGKVKAGAVRYRSKTDANPDLALKYGQGWINGERWEDDGEATRARASPNASSKNDRAVGILMENLKIEGKL